MSNAESSASKPGNRLVIALVAGEASGDQLGGALIEAIKQDHPHARFVGVGGPRMAGAGMECWWPADELAVMGLFEVLHHLPRLLRLRKALTRRIIETRPDLLVGIDAPDFNLGLERRVRSAGIKTAHYVSPTVWAWRQGRVRTIKASAETVMCLFPFEPAFYAEHGVPALYTGHPTADEIPLESDAVAARSRLGLEGSGPWVALLPGSRLGEVSRLATPLIESAKILSERFPGIQFLAPMANGPARECFEQALREQEHLAIHLVDGQSRTAMAAADVVACASGTAALEAMLVNRPMVVTYKLSALTYFTARALRLFRNRFFSLPNLLAGEALVPELLQKDATPQGIATEVSRWLTEPEQVKRLQTRFNELHNALKRDAARSAASCVTALIEGRVE